MKKIQYALVEADGSPVYMTEQSDNEWPIVDNSLGGLIEIIGEWCDMYPVPVKPDGTLTLDGQTMRIVRQEVVTVELTAEDLAGLADEEDDVDELHRCGVYEEN